MTQVSGNSTYAGATAAITANLVLVGYVIVAMREEDQELSSGTGAGSRSGKSKDGGGGESKKGI